MHLDYSWAVFDVVDVDDKWHRYCSREGQVFSPMFKLPGSCQEEHPCTNTKICSWFVGPKLAKLRMPVSTQPTTSGLLVYEYQFRLV
jgi:hypothetical protein